VSEITVHAEETVGILRESSLFKSSVESRSAIGSVIPTASANMVNREKLKVSFPATFALGAVGSYNSLLELAIVLPKVFLAATIRLLFGQYLLPVCFVISALVIAFGLWFNSVSGAALSLAVFLVLFVILGVLLFEVIRMRRLELFHSSLVRSGILSTTPHRCFHLPLWIRGIVFARVFSSFPLSNFPVFVGHDVISVPEHITRVEGESTWRQ